jgi:hypothetical protein
LVFWELFALAFWLGFGFSRLGGVLAHIKRLNISNSPLHYLQICLCRITRNICEAKINGACVPS